MRAGIFVIVLIGITQLMGQGKMVFQKTAYDFGKVLESDGPTEVTFYFINEGDSAIQVLDVRASCGCTAPLWSTEPVLAGDTGLITVKYMVTNRPGPFSKSVQVVSNGEPESQVLEISGHVTPLPKSIEKELPVRFGALRMKHRSLNMGKITTEKVTVKSFDVYNDFDSVLRFDTTRWVLPEHLKVSINPTKLEAKSRGLVEISYDPGIKNILGYQTDTLTLKTDDPSQPVKEILLNATIEEYFPEMTPEEVSNAPQLTVTDKILNQGSVSEGEVVTAEFVLKNNGKQTLNIRGFQPNCVCLKVQLKKMEIEPGEEAILQLAFDTTGRTGKQYKQVTIFSNDPRAPARTVTIRADVKEVN